MCSSGATGPTWNYRNMLLSTLPVIVTVHCTALTDPIQFIRTCMQSHFIQLRVYLQTNLNSMHTYDQRGFIWNCTERQQIIKCNIHYKGNPIFSQMQLHVYTYIFLSFFTSPYFATLLNEERVPFIAAIRDAPLNCNDIVNYFIAICQGDHSITKSLFTLTIVILAATFWILGNTLIGITNSL